MKKLLSILLSLVMTMTAMTSLVSAEDTTTPQTGADYFPNWTVKRDTIERVYDEAKQSHMAKMTWNNENGWNALIYTVPKSKLVSDHLYTVSAYFKTEGFENQKTWIALDWGAVTDKNPEVKYFVNGGTHPITGLNLYAHNEIKFGLTHAATGAVYVDDIVVKDETTGEVISLENTDFEKVASDYVSSTDLPGWTVATDVAGTTVERVFHSGHGSWMIKLTNDGTGKDIDKVKYTIPKSKLTEGHTYKVTMYSDIDSTATSGYIYFNAGGTKYGNTSIGNHKNGRYIELKGLDLYAKNSVYFGFDTNAVQEWYLDNLVVTDETTGEVVDLENTDFEKVSADYVQPANSVTMPGWSVNSNEAATVERVYDISTDNHYAKLTNLGTGATYNKLYYQIPTSKFDPSHSYTISAKLRTANYTNSDNWVALSWGGQDNTPWIEQGGMQKGWITLPYTKDGGFTGKLGFGFTHAPACELYIDDLMVYDNTTGAYIELENADFESTADDSVSFTKNNGGEATATIISRNKTYDINLAWATYAVDEDGNETLDNVSFEKKTITASDDVQSFTVTPEIKAGYVTKAFLWKADSMKPLATALEFEAVESAE